MCTSRTSTMEVLRCYWKWSTCVHFYKTKVYNWNQRLKDGNTDILSTHPIQPGSCNFLIQSVWTDFGPRWSKICHKRHKHLKNNSMKMHFINGFNDMKSVWNWKMFTLKKNDTSDFQLFNITWCPGKMKWCSVILIHKK